MALILRSQLRKCERQTSDTGVPIARLFINFCVTQKLPPVSTPPHSRNQGLDLSDREAEQLDTYAKAHGLTRNEAATQLAQQTLAMRYRGKPKPSQVLPFRRR